MKEATVDIRFLERNQIDQDKWDRCITSAHNGLIYARCFYLDAMAENWSALVKGDYLQVMPIIWNRKFGFHYIYQPYFTKALGVFGESTRPVEISKFLEAIPGTFKYWDIDLNENNIVSDKQNRLKIKQHLRNNQFLSLNDEYEQLNSRYKRLARRMKKTAVNHQMQISTNEEPSKIIDLYRRDYGRKQPSISTSVYDRLKTCTAFAIQKNMAETYVAISSLGEILAYYLILVDDHFVYSLLGGSTTEGKKQGAFYLLTDKIIQDHSGINKIFRFEGSDIPGITFFNTLFNSFKVQYSHLHFNNLPFPFRYFK